MKSNKKIVIKSNKKIVMKRNTKYTQKVKRNDNLVKLSQKTKKSKKLIKYSNKPSFKKYYYLIKSDYYDKSRYKEVIDPISLCFKRRGNWELFNEKNPQKKDPDFLFIDTTHIHHKSLWNYTIPLVNNMDIKDLRESIFNKYKLHDILSKTSLNKNHLLDQTMINLHDIFVKSSDKKYDEIDKYLPFFIKNKVNILKPIYGNSGTEIKTFNDFNECKAYIINYINKHESYFKKFDLEKYNNLSHAKLAFYPKIEWVLQEYINSPLLFKGFKFHLRGHIVYFSKGGKLSIYLYDDMRIITAKKPYKQSDYGNKEIHDTHALLSIHNKLTFKKDFVKEFGLEKAEYVFKQLKEISKIMSYTVDIDCYPENKNCFHVCGFDIMITDDYIVKIIENNHRGTIGANFKPNNPSKKSLTEIENEYNTIFNYKLISSLCKNFVDDIFPSKNKILENGNKFIEL
jgi:hypothetical protein